MTDETNKDPGAEVIPFPGQIRPPVDDVENLKQAIYFLNQAVAELHHKISDWRGVTNLLSVGIGAGLFNPGGDVRLSPICHTCAGKDRADKKQDSRIG